ncbi:hypothetical protein DYB35_008889 [Aphanomyces astaci]|nr:hypothetical protein DYB35_008889 [Aphanomyces astaci]
MAYQQGECSEATSYIREALEIDPTNKAIRELVPLVKEKREAQKVKDKQLYAKLGKANTTTAPLDAPSATSSPSTAALQTAGIASVVLVAVIALIYSQYFSP